MNLALQSPAVTRPFRLELPDGPRALRPTVLGAVACHKSGADSPPPRNLATEISQILSQSGPLLRSQQELSPQNVGLDLSNLQLALEGSTGSTQDIQYQDYVEQPVYSPQGWRQNEPRHILRYDRVPVMRTKTVNTPATKGLYDILGTGTQRVGDITNQANTDARKATYNDLRQLNPNSALGYDELLAGDREAYAAGDRLTPDQTSNILNPIRSDYARRGFAPGAMQGLDEGLQLFAGGNALGQQRRGNLSSTLTQGSQLYSLPSLTFGQPSNASGFISQAGAYGKQPSILQQLGGYGSDLFNTNFNSQAASNISQANADNANTSAAASAALAIALAAACWAAREVFGADDPRWLRFRHWLLYYAPRKLRDWYLENGELWAERLRTNPFAKAVVKRWMERRIARLEKG